MKAYLARVVGFSGPNALLIPFAALEGVRHGCRAIRHLNRGVRSSEEEATRLGEGYQRLEQILGALETQN